MNKVLSFATLAVTALFLGSCAKHTYTGPNDADKRYLEAWLQVNNIDVEPSGRGIYVLEDEAGNGAEVKKDGYIFIEYTTTDIDGNVKSYTNKEIAQQLGTYNPSYYYGPEITTSFSGNIYAGFSDMLMGMKVGGHKKAIIPSWLLSYKDYDTESKYLDQTTGLSTLVYDVRVKDFTTDINQWEIDSIGRFFSNGQVLIDGIAADRIFVRNDGTVMTANDSVSKGFYYKQLVPPSSKEAFQSDTTIYINYTGRLLNGQVFDTTIEDVAKDHNIYSSSKSYAPVQINWPNTKENEGHDKITMGTSESSLVGGFTKTLWQMKAMEKGMGVFYSELGYTYTGSGQLIPAYSPLIFEIEIVENPNK